MKLISVRNVGFGSSSRQDKHWTANCRLALQLAHLWCKLQRLQVQSWRIQELEQRAAAEQAQKEADRRLVERATAKFEAEERIRMAERQTKHKQLKQDAVNQIQCYRSGSTLSVWSHFCWLGPSNLGDQVHADKSKPKRCVSRWKMNKWNCNRLSVTYSLKKKRQHTKSELCKASKIDCSQRIMPGSLPNRLHENKPWQMIAASCKKHYRPWKQKSSTGSPNYTPFTY